jgi:hypothetical protein
MDHRSVDAGFIHGGQSFVLQIRRLTVMSRRFAFGPEVDLCVNDHHGIASFFAAAKSATRCNKMRPGSLQTVIQIALGKTSQRVADLHIHLDPFADQARTGTIAALAGNAYLLNP